MTYTGQRIERPASLPFEPRRVELTERRYLDYDAANGVYMLKADPIPAPVGDWADGLDMLPPTAAQYRGGVPSLTPAPVRPRASVSYRRIRATVRALSVAFLMGLALLAGAALQSHNVPAFLAAVLPLLATASVVLFGDALAKAGQR